MPEVPTHYVPRGDRVLVLRKDLPQPVAGDVIIPRSHQKQLDEGTVVAVGPGLRNRFTGEVDKLDLVPGDEVLFVEYGGTDVEVDGVQYLSVRDEEIHGIRPSGKPGKTRVIDWRLAAGILCLAASILCLAAFLYF